MTERVPRIDRVRIRFDFSSEHTDRKDVRGYVRVWGTVISKDALLEYGPADGIVGTETWVERVPESTVFDAEALRTLTNAPVTFLHPPEPLNTENTSRYSAGSIIETKRVGDDLRALHLLTDERVIQAARRGVIELSPGYTMIPDMVPGKLGGRHYDASQEGRIYNHNAIVFEARAGQSNALDKIDSLRGLFSIGGLRVSQPRNDHKMATIKDEKGTDHEVSDEVAAMFAGLKSQSATDEGTEDPDRGDALHDPEEDKENEEKDDSGTKDSDTKGSEDSKPGRGDGMTSKELDIRFDSFETKLLGAIRNERKQAQADAQQRAELEATARSVLQKSYSCDGKSDQTIMLDALKAVSPNALRKGQAAKKDASRLRGVFDALVEDSPASDTQDSNPLGGTGRPQDAPATADMVRDSAGFLKKRRDHIGKQKSFGSQVMSSENVINFDPDRKAAGSD